jgi:two-component system response regulator DevR
METIKVMLVEDDPFWLNHLAVDLNAEQDLEVVVMAATKEEALAGIRQCPIDVVLLDIHLTGGNLDGLDAAKAIKQVSEAKVIMLTSMDEKEVILDAFCKGADNFIYKSSFRDIIGAVRDAYRNRVSIHADVSQILASELVKERKLRILTAVERELYDLQEQGLSKTEMAKYLYKSVYTVKNQLRKMKEKLTRFEGETRD